MMHPPNHYHGHHDEHEATQPPVSSPKKRKMGHGGVGGGGGGALSGGFELGSGALGHFSPPRGEPNGHPHHHHAAAHMHAALPPPPMVPGMPLPSSGGKLKPSGGSRENLLGLLNAALPIGSHMPPPHPHYGSPSIPPVPRMGAGGSGSTRQSSPSMMQLTTSPPPLNFGLLPLSRSSSPSFQTSGSSASAKTWTSSGAGASGSPFGMDHGGMVQRLGNAISPTPLDFMQWPSDLNNKPAPHHQAHPTHHHQQPPRINHHSSLVLPSQAPSGGRSVSPSIHHRSPSPGHYDPKLNGSSSYAPFAMEDEEQHEFVRGSALPLARHYASPAVVSAIAPSGTPGTKKSMSTRASSGIRKPNWKPDAADHESYARAVSTTMARHMDDEEVDTPSTFEDCDGNDADCALPCCRPPNAHLHQQHSRTGLATAVAVSGHAVQAVLATTSGGGRSDRFVSSSRVLPPGVVLATRAPLPPGTVAPQMAKVLTSVPPGGLGPANKNSSKSQAGAASPTAAMAVAVPLKKGSRAKTDASSDSRSSSVPVAAVAVLAGAPSPSPRGRVRSVRGRGGGAGAGGASARGGRVAAIAVAPSPTPPSPSTMSSSGGSSPSIPPFGARSPLKRPLDATYSSSSSYRTLSGSSAILANGQQPPMGSVITITGVPMAFAAAVSSSAPRETPILAHAARGMSSSSRGKAGNNANEPTLAVVIPSKGRASTVSAPATASAASSAPTFHAPRQPFEDHSFEMDGSGSGTGASHFSPPSPMMLPLPSQFGAPDAHAHTHSGAGSHGHGYTAPYNQQPYGPYDSHFGGGENGYRDPSVGGVGGGGLLGGHDDGSISTDHFFHDDLLDEVTNSPLQQGQQAGMPETPRTQAMTLMMGSATFRMEGPWERRPIGARDDASAFALSTPPPPQIPSLYSGGLLGRSLPLHTGDRRSVGVPHPLHHPPTTTTTTAPSLSSSHPGPSSSSSSLPSKHSPFFLPLNGGSTSGGGTLHDRSSAEHDLYAMDMLDL